MCYPHPIVLALKCLEYPPYKATLILNTKFRPIRDEITTSTNFFRDIKISAMNASDCVPNMFF